MDDNASPKKYIWLDCDPGHDDATAILLAVNSPNIHLLGISTVHGNAPAEFTAQNAARCLHAFGAQIHVKVYPGVTQPLLVPVKHDPEIHGLDGLGGVVGLPDATHPQVRTFFASGENGIPARALDGMSNSIRQMWNKGAGHPVTVVSTGPMTNVALFVSVYPDLLEAVEEFVFMGGAVGLGNRSSVAEYNILCDPHAAQIVLNAPVKKTMIPLNVTHTAIFTKQLQSLLLSPDTPPLGDTLPAPSTSLRHTLSTLIGFFADSYKSTFGFDSGPPLHDALTIGYISRPDLFEISRYHVDIELAGTHTMGETVADVWNYRSCDDSWGPQGKNCQVARSVDVTGFFDLLLECVKRCDVISPLNKS